MRPFKGQLIKRGNKKPPEGGFLFLGGLVGIQPGPRMSDPS